MSFYPFLLSRSPLVQSGWRGRVTRAISRSFQICSLLFKSRLSGDGSHEKSQCLAADISLSKSVFIYPSLQGSTVLHVHQISGSGSKVHSRFCFLTICRFMLCHKIYRQILWLHCLVSAFIGDLIWESVSFHTVLILLNVPPLDPDVK